MTPRSATKRTGRPAASSRLAAIEARSPLAQITQTHGRREQLVHPAGQIRDERPWLPGNIPSRCSTG